MNNKFFGELSRRLKREGITTLPVEQERMPVLLDGQEVMAVAPGGTIFLQTETADSQPVMDAYDVVTRVTAQVCEYTGAMAVAPRLKASGLVDEHRQFTDEQLAEVCHCVRETLDSEYPMTIERHKLLTGISEQIQHSVDDLDELVGQSNQRELEEAELERFYDALEAHEQAEQAMGDMTP